MTSQTENSTACDTACALDFVRYSQPYVQAVGQQEDYTDIAYTDWRFRRDRNEKEQHRQVHNQIQEQLRILRTSIDAVQRIHDREIATLYRLIEERTLILSDVDEIYNDYC